MRLGLAALTLCCIAPMAHAGSIQGSIDDPSLRRKTEVIYVETMPGKFDPPAASAVMNQIGNTYSPKLLTAMVGQKVEFKSADPELHNVYAREGKSVLFNQAVLPKHMFDRVFDKPGVVHLSCNIHKPDAQLSDEQKAKKFTVTVGGQPVKLAQR
jgi:plastocyanin